MPNQTEALIVADIMKRGDPNCPIPLGARIRKVICEPKDLHMAGDEGEVIGSIKVDDICAYLVRFDNDFVGAETFLIDAKIERIS